MATGIEGPLHQIPAGLERLVPVEVARDHRFGHQVGQAVGAQQQPVARPDRQPPVVYRRLQLRARADGLVDHVPMRVGPGRRVGQLAKADHLGHQRMITAQPMQAMPAQNISPAVADMPEISPPVDKQDYGERRAHAGQRVVAGSLVENGGVCLGDGFPHQRRRSGSAGQRPAQHDLAGDPAGHLAGRMAAHPVGDDRQGGAQVGRIPRPGQYIGGAVLIVATHPPAVAQHRTLEPNRRARQTRTGDRDRSWDPPAGRFDLGPCHRPTGCLGSAS